MIYHPGGFLKFFFGFSLVFLEEKYSIFVGRKSFEMSRVGHPPSDQGAVLGRRKNGFFVRAE